MKIVVRVRPNAKVDKVERLTQPSLNLGYREELTVYRVHVKAPPRDNQANEALVRVLAEYFDTAPTLVRLVSGRASKAKVFEIL